MTIANKVTHTDCPQTTRVLIGTIAHTLMAHNHCHDLLVITSWWHYWRNSGYRTCSYWWCSPFTNVGTSLLSNGRCCLRSRNVTYSSLQEIVHVWIDCRKLRIFRLVEE